MSAAATPDLSYIVGGCMDSVVHIWHFQASPEAAAAARMKAAEGSGEDSSSAQQEQQELVEFSCGGYASKVTGTVFSGDHTMLATLGGTQCIVWDFTGPNGPAGSIPVVGLGHTKTLTCQVGWFHDCAVGRCQVKPCLHECHATARACTSMVVYRAFFVHVPVRAFWLQWLGAIRLPCCWFPARTPLPLLPLAIGCGAGMAA